LRVLLPAAGGLLAGVLAAALLFLLSVWIGPLITRNAHWSEPERGVTIMIGDNGIHTEIFMPIVTDIVDWRDHFPPQAVDNPSPRFTHVSLSWGERTFFLETPSWSELDPLIGISALLGGEALFRAAFYADPLPDGDLRPLRLREEEYRRLVAGLTAQLPEPEVRRVYPGYGSHDFFTTALGRYHVANTCNQWTSDRLAAAGVRAGLWTPLPGGVMRHFERP
jgi:uncharacterized protein (TIGR02117 family)